MPKPFNQIHADQAIAICTREQAEQLVNYDHHAVQVMGRPGVVLTVVFRYAERHPHAPEEIQSIVDDLDFQVRGQPR